MLESGRIHELEGVDGLAQFQFLIGSAAETMADAQKQLLRTFDDDNHACARVFRVLKGLITCWPLDLASSQQYSVYADMMIAHFYRWMSNPCALLYDPAVHRLVHVLMKKVALRPFWCGL